MIRKLIVMLVSVMRGRIQERTRNFGHLVHETCPRNCVWSVFKFYKKTNEVWKSWNLLRCRMSWFISIVRDNVHQTFSNFYHSLHIWYHDISTSFMIFGLRLLFIEFKNTSHASTRSCFVNKMSEISGPFLDTASHYTQ